MSATAFQRRRRLARLAKEPVTNLQEDSALTALTNKELKALLDQKGIGYEQKANKETLIKLLEGAE